MHGQNKEFCRLNLKLELCLTLDEKLKNSNMQIMCIITWASDQEKKNAIANRIIVCLNWSCILLLIYMLFS